MHRILLAAILITAPLAAVAGSPPAILSCEGPFARDSGHVRLIQVFGAANVAYTKIDGAEGETIMASVVYGKDPKRRLEIVWKDAKARKNPFVMAKGKDSVWKTGDGIGGGASVAEIEKLNGKPFKLSGFGWDLGGNVTDLAGGALARRKGGCILGLTFDPVDVANPALDKVSGDKEFLSSDRNIRAAKPIVSQITIGWPQ